MIALGVVGCESPPESPIEVTRTDSAGVEIVVSPVAGIGLPWTLKEDPEVVIGEGTDDPRYLFQFAWSFRDPRGRIVVLDAAVPRVAMYDSAGTYLREFGRGGQGPGEYRLPSGVFFAGDTVFVAEPSYTLSAFAGDGTFLDSWRPPEEPLIRLRTPPSGRIRGPGTPAGWFARLSDGSLVIPGAGSIDPAGDGIQRAQVPLARWWPDQERIDTLGSFEGGAAVALPSPQGGVSGSTPHFATGVGLFFDSFGETLVLSNGLAFEITSHDANGLRIRQTRVPRAPTVVTDDMLRELRERMLGTGLEEGVSRTRVIEQFDAKPTLESVPPFEWFFATSEGYVWAKAYQPLNDLPAHELRETHHVFAPDGSYLGAQELPAGFRLTDSGESWVLGSHTDELGVQSVQLYRLIPKSGG